MRGVLLGVSAVLLAGTRLTGGDLPWGPLVALLVLGAASNAALWAVGRQWPGTSRVVPAALAMDVCGLTAFLALSGGPHNPFSFLYVLLLVTGALLLRPVPTAALTIGIGLAFASLYALPRPPHDHAAMERHLQGMWLAYAVCGPLLALVVHQLRARAAAAERSRREAEASAARAERLASLATLAAGAAHEIASPLGTIAVIAEELGRASDPAVRADGELVAREVQRCRAVLQQLAADAGAPRVEGVSEVAVSELVRGISDGATVRDDAPGARVRGAPTLLAQALRRLVANAERAGGPVEIHVDAPDGRVRVRIRDRGPGMTPDVLARVGEPFFTTHGGMGLGVYFARDVVVRSGGAMSFDSEVGQGTTVTVTLPRGAG